MFLKYINVLNKRPKLSQKVGITNKEIRVYKSRVVGLFSMQDHANSFNFTTDRIIKLFEQGENFAFLYLKECLRLVICFISGSPETVGPGKGIIVARDQRGLPKILDSLTRQKFVEGKSDRKLVTAYLTLLSVYRVFPTQPKVNLDTIVSEFNGLSRTFESKQLRLALKDLLGNKTKLKLQAQKLIHLETASPNGSKSTGGATLDSLAFFGYPKKLYSFIKYQNMGGRGYFTVWLCFLLLLSFPMVSMIYLWNITFGSLFLDTKCKKKYEIKFGKFNLGRIGVVLDQAGKARVVGITNFWIQLALKPLHDSLFRLLKTIQEDGTFDQTKKIQHLRKLGKKFHCFDLSSATDRLPIDIQKDILNILSPDLGNRGKDLLDFSGYYKGQYIKYSVGQPMGAYSSGAMLALTHHVLVKLASLKVGIKNFTDYSVLGDDIVICNDDVAQVYLELMSTLGVGINMSKSVISNDILEFAKRGMGPNYDVTPIGPGLILRFIRAPYYIGAVLNDSVRLGIINDFPKLLTMLKDIPAKEYQLALWSAIGLGSQGMKMSRDTSIYFELIRNALSSVRHPYTFQLALAVSLGEMRVKDGEDSIAKLEKEEAHFYKNGMGVFSSKSGPARFVELSLKLVGPGFGSYALSFERAKADIEQPPLLGDASWQSIIDHSLKLDSINTSSIDGTQKRKVKSSKESIRSLNRLFTDNVDNINMYGLERMLSFSPYPQLGFHQDDLNSNNFQLLQAKEDFFKFMDKSSSPGR